MNESTQAHMAIVLPIIGTVLTVVATSVSGLLTSSLKKNIKTFEDKIDALNKKVDELDIRIERRFTTIEHDTKSTNTIVGDVRAEILLAKKEQEIARELLLEVKTDTKEIAKLEGKFDVAISDIKKIPEIKKDLDEAHQLIREKVKDADAKNQEFTKRMTNLEKATSFFANKLMIIRGIAEKKGWKLGEYTDWQVPHE